MLKAVIALSLLTITAIIHCAEIKPTAAENATTNTTVTIQDNQCPLLFYYNNESNQCECLSSSFSFLDTLVKCVNNKGLLRYNYCMTYKKETNTLSVATSVCTYFELSGHNISEPGFISVPDNISELNDYMCGPMNRKGILCSECIDGYGPSVTSPNFRCSDCSNAWYGIPLYLLLELVPVTVFYLIMLIFQVNITSAPMISFIFYSNIILHSLNFNFIAQDRVESQALGTMAALSYGIWSLDFFRYVIPPFCISPHLKVIHVLYLQSVSTVFPYVLIAFTWLCIELYSRDYKVVTVPWQLLNRVIFKHTNVKWNSGRTVIDAFATFFLISFSKLSLVLLIPLYPQGVHNLNLTDLSLTVAFHSYTDTSVNFVTKEHLPFAVISIAIFIFLLLPPVLLLAFYPFQKFRSILFKFLPKRSKGPLNIFVEKFYSCYRDGLDGGRDMRSFAALYFFILLIGYFMFSIKEAIFFPLTVLTSVCSLFIANIQPYKKRYMSVIDSLIFATLALLSAAIDRNVNTIPYLRLFTEILRLIPALGLFSFVVYKLTKKPLKMIFTSVKQKLPQVKRSLLACCNGHKDDRAQDEEKGNNENNHDEDQLPDRLMHPELYDAQDQPTY